MLFGRQHCENVFKIIKIHYLRKTCDHQLHSVGADVAPASDSDGEALYDQGQVAAVYATTCSCSANNTRARHQPYNFAFAEHLHAYQAGKTQNTR